MKKNQFDDYYDNHIMLEVARRRFECGELLGILMHTFLDYEIIKGLGILHVSRSLLADTEEAEDALQDVAFR